VVAKVAPVLHTARLLAEDADYRELTQILPVAVATWPKISFSIDSLDREQPVTVTADMGLSFINPDGHQVLPDGDVLNADVVRQAHRPYAPLQAALATPDRQAELFARFPSLQNARVYALAAASLAVYCRDRRQVCRAWQKHFSLPAPRPFEQSHQSEEAVTAMVLGHELIEAGWLATRVQVAEQTRDREDRRSLFVDEANFSLAHGPRWDDKSLLSILPVLPSTDYEAPGPTTGVGGRARRTRRSPRGLWRRSTSCAAGRSRARGRRRIRSARSTPWRRRGSRP
jgi:hypothetical protein